MKILIIFRLNFVQYISIFFIKNVFICWSGCGQCGGQTWMLSRHSAEGFKLGNFLGQHQGFQKVNTGEESEEEEEVVPFA